MKRNVRLLQALLLLLIGLSFNTAIANEPLTSQQKVGIGLMHALKNEKKQAWEILFPEAKAGNVDAMYHLGQLMARSPEFPDHLKKAQTFFSAADKKGHKGAKAMLAMVNQQIGLKSKTGPKMIGGKSALPTPVDMEKAKLALARQRALNGRFTTGATMVPPDATIHVFIKNEIPYADKIADMESVYKSRYGDKLQIKYYVVIDQSKWDQGLSFESNGTPNNMIGFEPDMNGEIARSKGVRQVPSIFIESKSGKKIHVQNPDQINSELAGIFQ